MIGWSSRTRRAELMRRAIALAALFSFAIGNVGWPRLPEAGSDQAGPRGCCGRLVKVAGPGGCCCGANAQKASCRCCQRPAVAKTGGCCQKKQADRGKSPLPALTCHCGDSPVADYVISSQPRLPSTGVSMPQLLEAFAMSPISPLGSPQGALPPETPPPRASVS
jgi:hypothetical protein